jgi:hypothetical protein
MDSEKLAAVAAMLGRRNSIDADIARAIGRPMTSGHLGEWIASQVFDIELEVAANAKAVDGRFRTGPLADRTVNIKWYLKREGILDMTESDLLDYYLVITGPDGRSPASERGLRPWRIDAIYLLEAKPLLSDLMSRGRRVGVASSIRNAAWAAAEVFPKGSNMALPMTDSQRAVLKYFAVD